MNLFGKLAVAALAVGIVGSAHAVSVMDQIGSNPADFSGTGYASQQFEAAYTTYNVAAIDDFTLTGSTNLTQVDFAGLLYNNTAATWANVGDFNVDIYSSVNAAAANFSGDVAHTVVAHASATINTSYFTFAQSALVSLPVNITLGPGTYYIGVEPINTFGTNGQTAILGSGYANANPGGANAWQTNPGGAFGFTGNQQQIAGGVNLGYRINGNPVPEPASMAILGMGALALLRRRNRKA